MGSNGRDTLISCVICRQVRRLVPESTAYLQPPSTLTRKGTGTVIVGLTENRNQEGNSYAPFLSVSLGRCAPYAPFLSWRRLKSNEISVTTELVQGEKAIFTCMDAAWTTTKCRRRGALEFYKCRRGAPTPQWHHCMRLMRAVTCYSKYKVSWCVERNPPNAPTHSTVPPFRRRSAVVRNEPAGPRWVLLDILGDAAKFRKVDWRRLNPLTS